MMATAEPSAERPAIESPVANSRLLYTPQQAAIALSIGRSTVYELLASGELESVHIRASRRIPAQALTEFIERRRAAERAHGNSVDIRTERAVGAGRWRDRGTARPAPAQP